MIVFLEIPHAAGLGAFESFRGALGETRVGWLDRTATFDDLKAPETAERYAVVGGRMTLADAVALSGVALFATVVGDPVLRVLANWSSWDKNPEHEQHWIPHTLNLREAIIEEVAEVVAMTDVMMRHLRPPRTGPGVEAIVAELAKLPILFGFGEHPNAFARAMERRLGLERGTIDHDGFRETARIPKNRELHQAVMGATAADQALADRLKKALGERKVLTSDRL